jgi:hypothetical protein
MNTFWGLTSRDFYAGYKRIQGMPKTFYLEGHYLRTSSYSAIFCTGSGGVFVVRKAGGNPIVAIGPAGGGTPDQADAFPFGSSYPQATVQKQLDLVQQLQSIDPMLKSDFC